MVDVHQQIWDQLAVPILRIVLVVVVVVAVLSLAIHAAFPHRRRR